MSYIEILFVRKMFLIFMGVILVVGALILSTNFVAQAHVHVNGHSHGGMPIGGLFAMAGYATCVLTTMLAATLNRDRSHLPYIWTRPIPRERIAWSYILVDLAAIVLAYALVFCAGLVVFSNVPWIGIVPSADVALDAIRFLSIPLMWYGLVEVSTSWNGVRGSMVSGFSWAVFWVMLGISSIELPSPLGTIVSLLNLLNPLALFTSRKGGGIQLVDAQMHTIGMNFTEQTFLAYGIFIVALVTAVAVWKKMEA